MENKDIQIFVSYSSIDEWLISEKEPDKALILILKKRLEKNNPDINIKVWYDKERKEGIHPGEEWENKIKNKIKKSQYAILLIDQHFVTSEFIMGTELPCIIDEGLYVIPVFIGSIDENEKEAIKKLFKKDVQVLPNDKTNLLEFEKDKFKWDNQLTRIVNEIKRIVKSPPEKTREKSNPQKQDNQKIRIRRDGDSLKISFADNDEKSLKSHEDLKKMIEHKGVSHFEWENKEYDIKKLDSKLFDYLIGTIKINHILIPNLLNAIEKSCAQWDHGSIYKNIADAKKDDRDEIEENWDDCINFICDNLIGITQYNNNIDSLINIGESIEERETKQQGEQENIENYRNECMNYIKECTTIMETVINLSVAVLLTYLLNEIKNTHLTNEDIEEIKEYFKNKSKSLKTQVPLLHRLTNILPESSPDTSLRSEMLKLKDSLNENGKIAGLCKELRDLKQKKDLNRLDIYRVEEKILPGFLGDFAFLNKYCLISRKGIEYHRTEKCVTYIEHCKPFNRSDETYIRHEEKDIPTTPSYTVMLKNRGTEDKQCLYLSPFVIDQNALKGNRSETIIDFAFFTYHHNSNDENEKYLNYTRLSQKEEKKKKNNIIKLPYYTETSENKCFDIYQHNINCLGISFDDIMEKLTK